MKTYDLIVIGGGPAGTPVAMEYAKLNPDKKVAIVEVKGALGGECLFDGCIPSKIMQISANAIRELEKLRTFGIAVDDTHYKLVWEKIVQRKEDILSKRTHAAQMTADGLNNIEIIKARASFSSKTQLSLAFEDNHEETVAFKKAVIASGSKAYIPEYKGNGVDKVWTNEDFFDRMELPASMTIIGDGAIAIEFAQILSKLGVQINLIGRREGILKNVEKEFAEIILQELHAEKNVNMILKAEVTQIDHDRGFTISYLQDGKTEQCQSEKVLVATGRVANVEQLALEKADVKYEAKGIITDKHLLTSNQDIYANGDIVLGFPKFAHTSMYGAHTIAQNLFLENNLFSVDFSKNSWVLFSTPNIATVGLSEAEAKAKEIDLLVGTYDYSIDARFQIEDQQRGYLKFVVEKKSKKIIGVSILLDEANAVIGEGAVIVAKGLTLSDLIDTIHPHPTFSESFSFLAKQMMGEIMLEKLKNPVVKTLLEIERFL